MTKTGLQNIHVLLPAEIITAINKLNLEPKIRSRAILICTRIFQNFIDADVSMQHEYVQIPKSYFYKFDTNYSVILNILKDASIVQVLLNEKGKPLYSKNAHLCCAYRLNPELITTNFASTTYLKPKRNGNDVISEELRSQITESLKQIEIDFKATYAFIDDYVNSITIADFVVQNATEIPTDSIEVRMGTNAHTKWVSKDSALKEAAKLGMKLFVGNNSYCIDNEEEYVDRKKKNIKYRYLKTIKDMEKGIYPVMQSESNNRVFTNITNTANKLLQFYSLKGENLISNDLSNSQIVILTYLFKSIINNDIKEDIRRILGEYELRSFHDVRKTKSNDITLFIELAETGKIYDYLMNELTLKDRNTAKLVMFNVLFSSHESTSTFKRKFSTLFPTIMEMVDGFKRDNDSKEDQIKGSLPIMLQQVESHIFINKMYQRITDHGFTVFSKHDSFLSATSDASAVKEIMESLLIELGIVAAIKTENTKPDDEFILIKNEAITNDLSDDATVQCNAVENKIDSNDDVLMWLYSDDKPTDGIMLETEKDMDDWILKMIG